MKKSSLAQPARTGRSRVFLRAAILVAALAIALLLLFIAVDSATIYAPGAGHVARFLYDHFQTLRGFGTPIGFVTIDSILRKIYALAAFVVVGGLFAPLFSARERVAGSALAVTQFSTVIEVLQRMNGARESIASNLFDIACGTIGGLVGAFAFATAARLAARARNRSAAE